MTDSSWIEPSGPHVAVAELIATPRGSATHAVRGQSFATARAFRLRPATRTRMRWRPNGCQPDRYARQHGDPRRSPRRSSPVPRPRRGTQARRRPPHRRPANLPPERSPWQSAWCRRGCTSAGPGRHRRTASCRHPGARRRPGSAVTPVRWMSRHARCRRYRPPGASLFAQDRHLLCLVFMGHATSAGRADAHVRRWICWVCDYTAGALELPCSRESASFTRPATSPATSSSASPMGNIPFAAEKISTDRQPCSPATCGP